MVKNYFLGLFVVQNGIKRIISYIDIQNQKGELIYRFPFKDVKVNLDFGDRKLQEFPIDHITFHADGTINLTPKRVDRKKRDRVVVEKSDARLPIKEVGNQHLLTDFIKHLSLHPTNIRDSMKLDREIVFEIDNSINSLFIRIDLLSGKNYISDEFYKIPFEDEEGRYISEELIGIGPDSGNSDKILVVSIFEHKKPETVATLRRFFIPKFNGLPQSTL